MTQDEFLAAIGVHAGAEPRPHDSVIDTAIVFPLLSAHSTALEFLINKQDTRIGALMQRAIEEIILDRISEIYIDGAHRALLKTALDVETIKILYTELTGSEAARYRYCQAKKEAHAGGCDCFLCSLAAIPTEDAA